MGGIVPPLAVPVNPIPRLALALRRCGGLRLAIRVLYEWLRGPRTLTELRVQEELFPREQAVPFDAEAAARAAALYARLPRPRGRELDLAIAACALAGDASLWTLNPDDFHDVPDLKLEHRQELAP